MSAPATERQDAQAEALAELRSAVVAALPVLIFGRVRGSNPPPMPLELAAHDFLNLKLALLRADAALEEAGC